jgi:NAD+ kinase
MADRAVPTDGPIAMAAGRAVSRVVILTHRSPEVTHEALPAVLSILEGCGVDVMAPADEVAKHPVLSQFPSAEGVSLDGGGEDLILTLGGDGSILRALAHEAGAGAPVIGVNYGRVGFLTSIEPTELERGLRRAIAGDYQVLELPSLRASWSDGEVDAVNDLALLRGGEARMADLFYSVDGEPVAKVRCDGVICSTPVGSTAYNLAAGGPAVSWRVRCFVLSFIAAHHLDTRPLVIGPEETLSVTNAAVAGDVDVLSDGLKIGSLAAGRSLSVSLGGNDVHLGIFPERPFFRRYREKFGRLDR